MHHGVRITDSALVAAATLSDRYITSRFLPDKAIDLVDEAGSRLRMEIDSRPMEIDEVERLVRRLEIEEMALAKEEDAASAERLEKLRPNWPTRRRTRHSPRAGRTQKNAIDIVRDLKEELEHLRGESERAERDGDLAKAAELRYGPHPGGGEEPGRHAAPGGGSGQRDAKRRRSGPTTSPMWWRRGPASRPPAARGRDGQAAAWRTNSASGSSASLGRAGRLRRGPAQPAGVADPNRPTGSFFVPRPDRRGRADRAGQGAGRLPVRRQAGDGPHRHERVRRKHSSPAWSVPLPATSATTRAVS